MENKLIKPVSIYRFLSSLAVTQEQLMFCKDDLISIQKGILNNYIEQATGRADRRQRERKAEENMKFYISAIEKFYNAANKILLSMEQDEEGSRMIDQMIEVLTESINKIQIEVK